MLTRFDPLFAMAFAAALVGCAPQGSNGETEVAPDTAASEEASDEDAEDQGETLVVTETGWLTVGLDGSVQTTFFDPDGRYRDYRNGQLLAQGNWVQRPDGTLCFDPDAGRGACWETGPMGDDRTAIATDGEGKRIKVQRVSYLAPADPQADTETDS